MTDPGLSSPTDSESPTAPVLTAEERQHVPGWLLELVDSADLYEIEYAARNCSTRYYIQILSRRADQLRLYGAKRDSAERTQ